MKFYLQWPELWSRILCSAAKIFNWYIFTQWRQRQINTTIIFCWVKLNLNTKQCLESRVVIKGTIWMTHMHYTDDIHTSLFGHSFYGGLITICVVLYSLNEWQNIGQTVWEESGAAYQPSPPRPAVFTVSRHSCLILSPLQTSCHAFGQLLNKPSFCNSSVERMKLAGE